MFAAAKKSNQRGSSVSEPDTGANQCYAAMIKRKRKSSCHRASICLYSIVHIIIVLFSVLFAIVVRKFNVLEPCAIAYFFFIAVVPFFMAANDQNQPNKCENKAIKHVLANYSRSDTSQASLTTATSKKSWKIAHNPRWDLNVRRKSERRWKSNK